MKKLAFLAFAILLSVGTVRVMAQSPQQPKPKAQATSEKPAQNKQDESKEKHPHMVAAKKALENAEKQLQQAAHDYNGHRTKAIELVDQAIKEINEGIASDKK